MLPTQPTTPVPSTRGFSLPDLAAVALMLVVVLGISMPSFHGAPKAASKTVSAPQAARITTASAQPMVR